LQPRLLVEIKFCLEQYGVPPHTALHALKRSEEDQDTITLFPHEDVLTKEIESWKGFADSLSGEEDRKSFTKMLIDCYKYAKAINRKAQPFPAEPLSMPMLFLQHKIIELLEGKTSEGKISVLNH
jgi:hypothetical protein